MYNFLKYSISIVSFVFIVLIIIFLLKSEYNAFSLVFVVSLEYLMLTILNIIMKYRVDHIKYNLEIFIIQLIGSIGTLIIIFISRTPGFSVFYILGIVWVIFLEYQDNIVKKNNPKRD